MHSFHEQMLDMCKSLECMLQASFKGLRQDNPEPIKEAREHARFVHQKEKEVLEALVKEASKDERLRPLVAVPTHIERIGDGIEEMMNCLLKKIEEGIPFSERAVQELTSLFEGALLVLECTKDTIITKNKVLSKYVKEEGERLSTLANDYATFHEERLVDGLCLSKASSLYLAILDAFKGIWWHCQQIVRKCT